MRFGPNATALVGLEDGARAGEAAAAAAAAAEGIRLEVPGDPGEVGG
jgi:hypothetical protein